MQCKECHGNNAKSNTALHPSATSISDVGRLIVADLHPSQYNCADVVICSPFGTLHSPNTEIWHECIHM